MLQSLRLQKVGEKRIAQQHENGNAEPYLCARENEGKHQEGEGQTPVTTTWFRRLLRVELVRRSDQEKSMIDSSHFTSPKSLLSLKSSSLHSKPPPVPDIQAAVMSTRIAAFVLSDITICDTQASSLCAASLSHVVQRCEHTCLLCSGQLRDNSRDVAREREERVVFVRLRLLPSAG